MVFTNRSIQLVVILPDGRLLLTRRAFSPLDRSKDPVWGKWEMSVEIDMPEEVLAGPVLYAESKFQALFSTKLRDDEFIDEVLEHSVGAHKTFICKVVFDRFLDISVPLERDVRAASFAQIEAEMDANREDYTPSSFRAMNLYEAMVLSPEVLACHT
jgi:hypothetical protein